LTIFVIWLEALPARLGIGRKTLGGNILDSATGVDPLGRAESSGTDKILTLDRRGFSSFRFGKNRRFELLLHV